MRGKKLKICRNFKYMFGVYILKCIKNFFNDNKINYFVYK